MDLGILETISTQSETLLGIEEDIAIDMTSGSEHGSFGIIR
jgi:hypothetical protein